MSRKLDEHDRVFGKGLIQDIPARIGTARIIPLPSVLYINRAGNKIIHFLEIMFFNYKIKY